MTVVKFQARAHIFVHYKLWLVNRNALVKHCKQQNGKNKFVSFQPFVFGDKYLLMNQTCNRIANNLKFIVLMAKFEKYCSFSFYRGGRRGRMKMGLCFFNFVTKLSFISKIHEWTHTFVANLRELSVSWKHSSLGDTFTNMRVLLLPPREFWRR